METTRCGCTLEKMPRFYRWLLPLLWTIVILSAVFSLLIFVIPLESFQYYGNVFETIMPVFCLVCCLYAYRTISSRVCLLLAAFAFMSYAFSNAYWYNFSIILGRPVVYISVAELGFFSFFLFLIAMIVIGFPDEGMAIPAATGLFLLYLVFPLTYVFSGEDFLPVHFVLFFVRVILLEQLIAAAIRHGVFRYPLLWAGICLNCMASLLYGLRETIFTSFPVPLFPGTSVTNPLNVNEFLSIVGPMSTASFALILAGLLLYIVKAEKPEEQRESASS